MSKLLRNARPRAGNKGLAAAVVLSVSASLLVAGTSIAQAEPKPAAPSKGSTHTATTFPKRKDPDQPLRDAIAEAQKQNKPVPVEAAYTESSRTWAYPDAHLTTETYDGPTQLKQADGSWAWIDTTLVESGGSLKPKLSKADVTLSLGGGAPFVTMERDKGQKLALSWLKDLPKPDVQGNVATYRDAAGPGADLVVTALPTGFQHNVVLRQKPTGPVEFRIPVQADKLKLDVTKTGGLALTNDKGKTVLSAPTPQMWDAATEHPNKEAPGRQAAVKTSVEFKGGTTTLVLKPDTKWLADPATAYPVTVDPTTTLGVTKEVGIRSPNGQTGSGTASRWNSTSSGDVVTRTLMAFDTSPVAGRQVVKSTMQLMLRTNGTDCVSLQSVVAQQITSAWVADNTFWSNQPSTTAEGRSVVDACAMPHTAGSVWSWDLTKMTQAWASGTANNGLMLSLGSEFPAPKYYTDSYSFWPQLFGQNVPKLSVDWVLPPEIPTVTAESIDSMTGNDAIARSTNVKVTYKSSVPETANLDYTVTVNDSTMAPPAPQLPAGEAAYWKLDETSGATAADSSGKNLPLTLNGTYNHVPGQLGQALKVSGGGYGTTTKPVLNTDQSYTVAGWVKLNSSTDPQTVFSQMGVNQPGFSLKLEASSVVSNVDKHWWLSLLTQDTANEIHEVAVISNNAVKIGEWTHVAIQYDQAAHKARLYMDGALAGEHDYTPTWNARGNFEIGRGRVIAKDLDGTVDDIHVYQRVLTADEIRTIVGVPGTTTNNNIPSGQVLDKIFTLDNPASFKFVVKACRSGITPPSCTESPAYRITSDAPMLPTGMETLLDDPGQPVLSALITRPSGKPVTGKFYLYDEAGNPVGATPLGYGTVDGDQRINMRVPPNTVRSGSKYSWQIQACSAEVCTSKTPAQTFSVPGPVQLPDPGALQNIVLRQENLSIKTGYASSEACSTQSCALVDDSKIKVGGTGADARLSVIKISLADIPPGSIPVQANLRLGNASCTPSPCPTDATVGITSLSGQVTSTSTSTDVLGALRSQPDRSATITSPNLDVSTAVSDWLILTSNSAQQIEFGTQSNIDVALSYRTPTPPSAVQNLHVSGAAEGLLASWADPVDRGSMAAIDSYDVRVLSDTSVVVKTQSTQNPFIAVSGLAGGSKYRTEVRAVTQFGAGPWEGAEVTVPLPPAATCTDKAQFTGAIKAYEESRNTILERKAASVDEALNGHVEASSLKAILYTQQPNLSTWASKSAAKGIQQTGSSVSVDNALIFYESDGHTASVHAEVSLAYTYAGMNGEDPGTDQTQTVHTYRFSVHGCSDIQVTDSWQGSRLVSVSPDLNAYPDGTPGQIPGDGMELPTDGDGFPDYGDGAGGGSGGAGWVNREAAAAWAVRHYNDDTDFHDDCTNFVSKALHYGGGAAMLAAEVPDPSQRGDLRWWWQAWPPGLSRTYSWSGATPFFQHFMQVRKRAFWVTSWKNVKVGDILLWDWDGGSLDFGHAAVVSRVTSGSWNGVEYAQHSDPYQYRKLAVSFPGVKIKHPNAKVYAIRVMY
ncbi:LamG-like jellyroll fold domain-containing protein [Nonomuraea sp. NPDC050536]|uniref:LamG-like jellyroll fold domain-containing protein n=1 Tax=Nonomuraea sp. NPDC050536 TaxID=3364366 RepID=UPI0037C757F0